MKKVLTQGLRDLLVISKKKRQWPNTAFRVIVAGNGAKVLVSPRDYFQLANFKWSIKKSFYRYYCGRWITENGKRKFIFIHRIICGCHPDNVIHHINSDTLDNRRENLQEMTLLEHTKYHSWR